MKKHFLLHNIYDPETFTHTYILYDKDSADSIVIDPVLNYDPASSTITHTTGNQILSFIEEHNLSLRAIIETHAHADHLTSAQWLKKQHPEATVAIGKNIIEVQKTFKEIYNLENLQCDGSQFDHLLTEDEEHSFGSIGVKTYFTPGHTPACCSYQIGQYLFTGDALFMPDYGTGRCDFPKGSSDTLYTSIHNKLYTLDPELIVCTGHDYCPGGREVMFSSTLREQMENNIQINSNTTRPEFVDFRNNRDQGLKAPRLLLPSIQFNIQGGKLHGPENNGTFYFKIPVRGLEQ